MKDNYQQKNKGYMTVSKLKELCKCEAKAQALENGSYEEPFKAAFLEGRLVEATLFNETLEDKRLYKKNGDLYKDYVNMIDLANFGKKHLDLSGEHSVTKTFELFGMQWRSEVDLLKKDVIVDIKTTRDSLFDKMWDSQLNCYVPAHYFYKYHWQMAVYCVAFGLEKAELWALSKKAPYTIEKIVYSKEILEQALIEVEEALSQDKFACGKCDYCRIQNPVTTYNINNIDLLIKPKEEIC